MNDLWMLYFWYVTGLIENASTQRKAFLEMPIIGKSIFMSRNASGHTKHS